MVLRTSSVMVDAGLAARNPGASPGPHVVLTVADTGEGMDAATLRRIFEPFFTTKARGHGTGLGLATCQGVVRQSGGFIVVESAPGEGTAFHVHLPAVDAPATEQERRENPARRGTETILLIEDDDSVRAVTARILQQRGYRVASTGTAEQAVARCAEHHDAIALVLSDVILRDATGPEVVAKLHERWPHLAVLFMSGYTDRDDLHGALADGRASFLQKPFTPDALARKVREALDG